MSTITAPGSREWEYTYNGMGQPVTVDAPNGIRTVYSYDARGRLAKIEHKDGATVLESYTYTLDDNGNIEAIDNADGTYWEYTYDARDRLTHAVRGLPGGNVLANYTYTYDAGDNLLTKVEPYLDDFNDGTYAGWTRQQGTWTTSGGYMSDADTTTQVEAISHYGFTDDNLEARYRFRRTSNNTADYTVFFCRYVNSSNYIRVVFYGNGTAQLGQWTGGVLTNLSSNSSVPTTVNTWYDVRVVCDGPNISVYHRTGDELETLILSTASAAVTTSNFVTFNNGPSAAYDFDDIRLVGTSLSNTTTFAVNNANELTSMTDPNGTTTFTYDAWGRMVSKARGSYTATYGYKYHDKLCTVTSNFPDEANVTYDYGGDGKRRTRYAGTSGNAYWWDAGYNVIEEASGSGIAIPNLNYVIDHPAASRGNVLADIQGYDPVTGTARYYTQDHLGSTRTLRSQAKATLARFDYDPYGAPTYHDGASATRTYTGHDLDPVTGMYFAPFRYYAPGLGRWTARDPLGMVDGANTVGYAKQSPLSGRDPLGLDVATAGCAYQYSVPNPFKDPLQSMWGFATGLGYGMTDEDFILYWYSASGPCYGLEAGPCFEFAYWPWGDLGDLQGWGDQLGGSLPVGSGALNLNLLHNPSTGHYGLQGGFSPSPASEIHAYKSYGVAASFPNPLAYYMRMPIKLLNSSLNSIRDLPGCDLWKLVPNYK